jgi:hypothetical protein
MSKNNNYQETKSIMPEIEFIPTVQKSIKFTHSQIHDALLFVQDIMERSSFFDFILLGDMAKAIHSTDLPTFEMDKVELGITKKQFTESGKSMFYSVLLANKVYPREYEDRFEFEYKGVPIVFRLFEDGYKYAKRPDIRFYMMTEFHIPNPFNKYLESIA